MWATGLEQGCSSCWGKAMSTGKHRTGSGYPQKMPRVSASPLGLNKRVGECPQVREHLLAKIGGDNQWSGVFRPSWVTALYIGLAGASCVDPHLPERYFCITWLGQA